jgi:exonuclease III
MYSIAKEAAKAKLQVCCLQEVRYRNIGSKVTVLNNDESYTFFWSGQKKHRNAGVGILIKKNKDITFEESDIRDPRVLAMNIQVKGFRIRLVNDYSPTNCDGSESQKDAFYRLVKKASDKQHKH